MIDRKLLQQLQHHLLRPIENRLRNLAGRAVVKLVADAKKLQLVQLEALEAIEDGDPEVVPDAEHHQAYGFSSVPHEGAEAILLFPNGDRGHPIAVAVSDRRYRPTGGQAGEVFLYTDEGDKIRMGRGHVISIETSGTLKLGSSSASEGAIKGTSRNTAEQTFLTALAAYANAIKTIADPSNTATPVLAAAITAFASAIAAAVSVKVKLE